MRRMVLRAFFVLTGLFYLALAVGFTLRLPAATGLWLWPDTRLSHLFIGSVAAALAAGALWTGASGRLRAAAPSLAGLALAFGTTGVFLWARVLAGINPEIALHALGYALATVIALVILAAIRDEAPDDRPLTPLVRWSCVAYSLTLAVAGAGLVLRFPNVFPWPLAPESSTVFGLTFIGLAVVYALTAWRGGTGAGTVAMAGFLAYDVVLLPPFLGHFAAVAPERLMSLTIYTAVLVYSAVVAAHYLYGETTGRSRRPA